jgi:hypothetical protein
MVWMSMSVTGMCLVFLQNSQELKDLGLLLATVATVSALKELFGK